MDRGDEVEIRLYTRWSCSATTKPANAILYERLKGEGFSCRLLNL